MRFVLSPSLFLLVIGVVSGGCSITAVRPTQEMSNMEVAIRAAKEVNADVLAPELYRLANETSLVARREYRYRNFQDAKKLADQARVYAEKAEFESIRNGGKREGVPEDPLAKPSYPEEPTGPAGSGPSSPTGDPADPLGGSSSKPKAP